MVLPLFVGPIGAVGLTKVPGPKAGSKYVPAEEPVGVFLVLLAEFFRILLREAPHVVVGGDGQDVRAHPGAQRDRL